MKIRIKGNTLRYRLTRSEVIALSQNGKLTDQTEFIGNTLSYSVQRSGEEAMSADFNHNTISLYIPDKKLQQWASTDTVGLENTWNGIYLLIEKDFKCIDGDVSEDQSDYFENPHITC
ncbi:hypothetical protein GCM10023149_29860 [Mucilaginibacter gynuensis]|uniref:Uncharacterized protein n=1 Tax=Mucilaginibacter gynuensis TaxID=1302236 RepID=A0ABP8GM48_9SPHI